ncbi:DUF742 domain-containing protein [Actinomycetospora soli]|uniref:DUF742 domain-containing protein n=1 Tax=Actinomycetospora soli TaxID=2893887 RepID=UPI001E5CBF8A|nr:DUF742 domain-containing protein [Actinomycetospora soli]MCD2187425.1 DUF742 domain-containing protein [Actinomycetospora soli]
MTEERAGDGRPGRLRRRQQLGRTGARFPRLVEAAPDEPLDAAPGEAAEEPSAGGATGADPASGDPMVGRTGARFGSRGRRDRRAREQQAAEDAVVPVQAPPVREPRRDPAGPHLDEAPTAPLHLAELRDRAEGFESRVSVRPYVRTRGRTRARADLLVETLISLPSPRPPLEDPEHVVIGGLCEHAPRSVAEVAALMQVPLGVARVLIGDMADGGTVRIHPTAAAGAQRGPDPEVMARVLRGLHGL